MPLDGPDPMASSVTGHTIDLSVGGLRVETVGHLPLGADPTVVLSMPSGDPLVARTTIVYAETTHDRGEYRLVFNDLEDADLNRLTALVGARLGRPRPRLEPTTTRRALASSFVSQGGRMSEMGTVLWAPPADVRTHPAGALHGMVG